MDDCLNSMLKTPSCIAIASLFSLFNDTHRIECECIEKLILLLSLFSCNASNVAEVNLIYYE